jgi:hypothetical protein
MNRAHRSLWTLTALAIFAAGLVSRALTAPAGPASDVLFGASVLLLLGTATLLARVIRYLSRTSTTRSGSTPSRPDRGRTLQPDTAAWRNTPEAGG